MIEILGRSFVTILYNVFVLRGHRLEANRLGKEWRTSDCTDILPLVDSGSRISYNKEYRNPEIKFGMQGLTSVYRVK